MFSQNTETFLSLGDAPDKVSENALIVIEMFVVLIYGRTAPFLLEILFFREHSAMTVSPCATDSRYCLSGRTHMGASKTEGPKAPKSCKLGLEKKFRYG